VPKQDNNQVYLPFHALLAFDARQADLTATIDAGWRRFKRGHINGWVDWESEFVRHIDFKEADLLFSLDERAWIYLGYGWHMAWEGIIMDAARLRVKGHNFKKLI
jgi:hypothetical protein